MVAFELFRCKSCGLELRRKRHAQSYCSQRCRNAAAQNRKRRKEARSGDGAPSTRPVGRPKRRPLPPYLEAVTGGLKSRTNSVTSEHQESHPYPQTPERLAKALRRPMVNLTERELQPNLISRILEIETASHPPTSGTSIRLVEAA
jgi:hypothetical protein